MKVKSLERAKKKKASGKTRNPLTRCFQRRLLQMIQNASVTSKGLSFKVQNWERYCSYFDKREDGELKYAIKYDTFVWVNCYICWLKTRSANHIASNLPGLSREITRQFSSQNIESSLDKISINKSISRFVFVYILNFFIT